MYPSQEKEKTYIMSVVEESHDVRSCCTITEEFEEFATRLARLRASIGKSGICQLCSSERGTGDLEWIRESLKNAFGAVTL